VGGDQDRFKHVKHLWRDDEVRSLNGLDRLVYRSNALGSDLTLTNTGGGNTSSKLLEKDPLGGEDVEVLWVKGSGGDLRTARRDGFASLHLEKVRAMKRRYLAAAGRGPKTQVEDEMYGLYSHCVYNLNPRACSIDTPLHTFVPKKHVDHLHPNAVIAVAASVNQERLCREVYGDELIFVPWQRPGFDIGLLIESLIAKNPKAKGVLLGHHGMSSWDDDDKLTTDPHNEVSLIYYPSRQGLEDRVFRIQTDRSSATTPDTRTGHSIHNIEVLSQDATSCKVTFNWATHSFRYDIVDLYFGTSQYTIDTSGEKPLIKR